MQSRRRFLQQASFAAASILATQSVMAGLHAENALQKLTILHTNDVHSRLEAFPMDGGRNQGMGGVAARSDLINKIRSEEEHVLLLDAGDIFQGTPFFNKYKGEPEIKAMTAMGYDAATMGNHDFDAGIENFATQLSNAQFPIVICNYDFSGTPMEFKHQPYKIIKKGKLKIGITGVGIELNGLVPDNLYGKTKYLDPLQKANEMAYILKKDKGCDLVICLSHLGYQYKNNMISDVVLAGESENIDLLIGGHTHTFLDEPTLIKNKNGSDVLVNQVGWAGIVLGRLDFEFAGYKKKSLVKAHTVVVRKKTSK